MEQKEDTDAKQQELAAWRTEEPTPAGPGPHSGATGQAPQRESAMMAHPVIAAQRDGCCHRLIVKCGPIGWYFSPMFDRLGYSLLTAFYHLIMFAFTLAVFTIIVTLFSVSVGLLVLVFGFVLYWWTCEIAVIFARIDLALAYYMVEDKPELIVNRQFLHLNLYTRITPCPCSAQGRAESGSFCGGVCSRMKSVALRCDMYKIFLSQMIFKPLIVGLTWWIFFIDAYVMACIFAPVVYIVDSQVFTKHYWCPFGDTDCDKHHNDCRCDVVGINDFWGALLFGLIAFLLLPLVLHISIWFAKASKAMTYYWLSNYYTGEMDAETDNLLSKSGSNAKPNHETIDVRDDSVSDNNNMTQVATDHSINKPYTNDV